MSHKSSARKGEERAESLERDDEVEHEGAVLEVVEVEYKNTGVW